MYDGVGSVNFDRSVAALRPRGMLVLCDAAGGPVPPVEIALLNAGSTFLTCPTLVHYVATREDLLLRSGDVYGWIADGSLDVRIGATHSLEDARRAGGSRVAPYDREAPARRRPRLIPYGGKRGALQLGNA